MFLCEIIVLMGSSLTVTLSDSNKMFELSDEHDNIVNKPQIIHAINWTASHWEK